MIKLLILLLLLSGCVSPEPFPEGDPVIGPHGYYRHCEMFPDSIFCVEPDDDE